jgi:cytochrome c oxidase subunit II
MPVHSSRARAALSSLALAFLAAGCMKGAAAPVAGADLYAGCVACHGAAGSGNATLGAPTIAGLPEWYVKAQLEKFQTGLRGKHADDAEGLRMRAMSKQMMSDAETAAVAAYVASLQPVKNAATIADGNAATGQAAFALCVPCHGAKGEGNEALKAPPLAGQDDWYVAAQIRKFKAGIRGTVAGDPSGPIMQATSMAIPPENVNHLAAYVNSLSR